MGYISASPTATSVMFNVKSVNNQLNKSLKRLSTGFKHTDASDGISEMAKAVHFDTRSRGSRAALATAERSISMFKMVDTAHSTIEEMLVRVREIAVSVANDGITANEYSAANEEISGIFNAIDGVAGNVTVDGNALMNGSRTTFIVTTGIAGINSVNIGAAFANNLANALVGSNFTTMGNASDAIDVINEADTALNNLATNRAALAGQLTQMTHYSTVLQTHISETEGLRDMVRNTDIAMETSRLTQLQVVQEAGTAALAQANIQASMATRLLDPLFR